MNSCKFSSNDFKTIVRIREKDILELTRRIIAKASDPRTSRGELELLIRRQAEKEVDLLDFVSPEQEDCGMDLREDV